MGGGCDRARFQLIFGPAQLTELLMAAVGTAVLPSNELNLDLDIDVSGFIHSWPSNFPVIPNQVTVILRAAHWECLDGHDSSWGSSPASQSHS